MRILLASLLLVTACASKKSAMRPAAAPPPPAATTTAKPAPDEGTESAPGGKDGDAKKSKRSGDPCEGGE